MGSRVWKLLGIPVRFALAYALLMAPWPGWVETYGKLYAGSCAWLFDSGDPERYVRITHFAARSGTFAAQWSLDTVVTLQIQGESVGHRKVPPFARTRSSRYTGYAPTALALALVFAAPIPWRRRAWAVPLAVLLASGFALLMVWLWIHGWFHAQESIWLARSSEHYASRARLLASLLEISGSFGPYYIAPVFIGALVSLRRADLDSLAAALSASRQSSD